MKVAVADSRLDEKFELHIADAEALAAFHHPVAYEAGRGIAFANPLRESFDLQTGELKRRDSCHREAFAAMVQFTPQGTYEEAVAYIDTIDRTATSPSIPAGS